MSLAGIERELIAICREASSDWRWTVGECAEAWIRDHARGRTDTDFATLVNLDPSLVYTCRIVQERCRKMKGQFRLHWDHFHAALMWEDAESMLDWASENEATVAEMKCWRRACRGEDLCEPKAQ